MAEAQKQVETPTTDANTAVKSADGAKATGATREDIEKNKVMGILAYLGILVLVPLLAAKESPFAQYHANQGLILFIAGIIVGAAAAVPIIGWFLIAPIGSIFLFVLAIMGLINAAQGEMKPLPLIGHYTILK